MRRVIPLMVLVLAIYSTVTMAQGNRQAFLPIVFSPGVPPPTLTASPTRTITPTPQSGGVATLPNSSFYEQRYSDGAVAFVGEAQNNTEGAVGYLEFDVELYSDGVLVHSFHYTNPYGGFTGYLLPGEKQCFEVSDGRNEGLPAFDSYVIHDPEYVVLSDPVEPLLIGNLDGGIVTGEYQITGFIANEQDYAYKDVSLNGTLYNANGVVVDCNSFDYNRGLKFDVNANRNVAIEQHFVLRPSYASVSDFRVTAYGIPLDGPLTPTPTFTITPTPSNTPTNTPLPTSTPTTTPAPVALVPNGDFELGRNGDWEVNALPDRAIRSVSEYNGGVVPHSGEWLAIITGFVAHLNLEVSQSVVVPLGQPYLHFYYNIRSSENPANCDFNNGELTVNGVRKMGLDPCSYNNTNGWELGSVDLNEYAGQTVVISFNGAATSDSYLWIDDVGFSATPN